jgi:hypothetical protein
MNGKAPRRGRNRRQLSLGSLPTPTAAVGTFTVSTVTVSVAFNVPVVVKGIPAGFSVADVTVNAVHQVDAQHITMTLSGSGAGKAWAMLANDPAIRTRDGGYVAAAAGTFP